MLYAEPVEDWYDNLVERWSGAHADVDLETSLIAGRISRVALHLARAEDDRFARFGLNRGEVGLLGVLRAAEPPHRLTPTRLMRLLMLSSAGVTGRVDRLERRGLVRRLTDPSDRRGVQVELTAEGERLLDEAASANAIGADRVFAMLNRQDRAALDRTLRKLLQALERPL